MSLSRHEQICANMFMTGTDKWKHFSDKLVVFICSLRRMANFLPIIAISLWPAAANFGRSSKVRSS